MRALLIALVACGGGTPPPDAPPPGVHELVACDSIWMSNGFTTCEGACVDATTALNAMGPACDGATSLSPVHCQKTFVYMGTTGCCASEPPQVLFAGCNP
jgi:hypothetical protein